MSLMVLVALSAVCTWGARFASELQKRETIRNYRLHKASMERVCRAMYEKSLKSTHDKDSRAMNATMIRYHADLEQKYLNAADHPESPMTPDPLSPELIHHIGFLKKFGAGSEDSLAEMEVLERKLPEYFRTMTKQEPTP